jgi:hypothetical protein
VKIIARFYKCDCAPSIHPRLAHVTFSELHHCVVLHHQRRQGRRDPRLCTVTRSPTAYRANLAAEFGDWVAHLNDDSWSRPLSLGFNGAGPWISGEEYALTVTIDPNGRDTWRFDYQLAIEIQNENGRIYTFTGHALSQNVRSNTYPFTL